MFTRRREESLHHFEKRVFTLQNAFWPFDNLRNCILTTMMGANVGCKNERAGCDEDEMSGGDRGERGARAEEGILWLCAKGRGVCREP